MFELEENKNHKVTVSFVLLEEAKKEISFMAKESNSTISKVVSQMIYECLGREKITGLSKKT